MGAPMPFDQKAIAAFAEAIEAHPDLRAYLSHHLRNSLSAIRFYAEAGNNDGVQKAVDHIIADLEQIGC